MITSEEFEKEMTDKSKSETKTHQIGNVKVIRQKLPEITVHILFNPGSDEIADDFSKKQLDEVGKALSSEGLSKYSFEIAGHTDSAGSEKLNLKLSKQRANAIKEYLSMKYKILPEKLIARGYGESMPVASNDTIAGRAKNRRVVIKRIK
ncbi:MAG: OmpA family protein [Thermodesulfobacteriota bacterium]|nr:OmpA family protein [Thermodesulfobacteriota bacterium]